VIVNIKPDIERGLTSAQAGSLLLKYGENRLTNGKKISPLKIFTSQFKDILMLILIASTVISVIMGEITEAVSILTIILLNSLLGFFQEYRTERTLEALKKMSAPNAIVLRDGIVCSIPAAEVVPNDIIMLKQGNKVPADAIIVEAMGLACDESLLSGESVSSEKTAAQSLDFDIKPGRSDAVYMGTLVTKGKGKAIAVSTGMSTQMGKIASMLDEIEEEPTPLQQRLDQLGKFIGIGCLAICAVVSGAGILKGFPVFDMLITGISLAVAAVPEGLPAVVTISLALAVRRILARNALVKKLHAVETLGCTNVICSDKTGTLTENKMTVKQICTPEYSIEVTGNGYQKKGEFICDNAKINPNSSPALKMIFEISCLCSSSQIYSGGRQKNRDRSCSRLKGEWNVSGEPTETALLVMAAKANVLAEDMPYIKLDEMPFDSSKKRMSVFVKDNRGGHFVFVKGAPDMLLERCAFYISENGIKPLTKAIQKKITEQNNNMAQNALRVLGFAYKPLASADDRTDDNLIFAGLAGMIDPPRPEAYEAVRVCKKAKIKIIMITGDHRLTAQAVAKELGIFTDGDRIVTGAELDGLSEQELEKAVCETTVFARVNPSHKLRIVKAIKRQGLVAAMTGDGVNDAPAVKEADIGVSMGESGTDVTKEAASIILLDDNFATLVAAVEEGRVIYGNIRKFIRYLLSCNIGEVLTMFAGMLMGMPVILLPMQILLINLVTDGLPAIALGLEPAEKNVMSIPPRSKGDSIFSGGLLPTIIFRGCLIGLSTLAAFSIIYKSSHDLDTARTAAMVTLIATQLFHVFECKSETKGLLSINIFNNIKLILAVLCSAAALYAAVYMPVLQPVFKSKPLSSEQLLAILIITAIIPLLNSIYMLLKKGKTQ